MHIGIDARVLEKKMTGIGRYLLDILQGIQSDKENQYYLFSVNEINWVTGPFIKVNTGNFKIPDKLYSPYWLNFILPKLVKKYGIDLYFSPNHLLPKIKMDCKSVVAIHDLHHLTNKQNHSFFYRNYLNFQLPTSIRNSDAIIAISENTKVDLIKNFSVDEIKIKVIYRVADNKFKPYSLTDLEYNSIKAKLNLPEKYVLFVGMIENRKNIMGILKTADIVYKKNPDLKFLLVGRPGYGFNSLKKEILKRKNVIYLNYVEEEDIISIYNLAFLFLFPSHYEGFGLPPLEAMQCGIPVLCSNIQSLQEVVGDNGLLRNAADYKGFADDILNLISDPKLYANMQKRSIDQAKKFSYEDSINKLKTIFNDLKIESQV